MPNPSSPRRRIATELTKPVRFHPLYDPSWASASIWKSYSSQLVCAEDIVREGCNLLMRCERSAVDLGRQTVVTVLYRQVLVAADGALLCLKHGAQQAAEAQLRLLLEARWGLRFALRDPSKWGLYVYVSTLRANRDEARRHIPGTPEWERYESSRRKMERAVPDYHELLAVHKEAVAATDSILSEEPFKAINDAFSKARSGKRTDRPWYCDGAVSKDVRVQSIYDLAVSVDARDEYDTAYLYGSRAIHGGHESTHRLYDQEDVSVAPLRSPDYFRPLFLFMSAQLLQCMLELMEIMRPDELRTFRATADAWRAAIRATQ